MTEAKAPPATESPGIAYVWVPVDTLRAAMHAFRSYEHGNAAPALAKECANELERIITKAVQTSRNIAFTAARS